MCKLCKFQKDWLINKKKPNFGDAPLKGNGANRQQDLLWSDKKMSTVEAVTDKLNVRAYALNSGDLPVNVWSQSELKKSVCVMLHQTWANLVWCSLMWAWKSTAKFIWTCCRKNFFFGSLKLLRTNKSPYWTMLQLTRGSFSLWLSVGRSWTASGGFRDKQMWTSSSRDINCMDFSIWSNCERDVSTRYHPNLDSLRQSFNQLGSFWTKKWCDVLAILWKPVSDLSSKQKASISKFSLFFIYWEYIKKVLYKHFFILRLVLFLLKFFDG